MSEKRYLTTNLPPSGLDKYTLSKYCTLQAVLNLKGRETIKKEEYVVGDACMCA
jgi:hypothetical protein